QQERRRRCHAEPARLRDRVVDRLRAGFVEREGLDGRVPARRRRSAAGRAGAGSLRKARAATRADRAHERCYFPPVFPPIPATRPPSGVEGSARVDDRSFEGDRSRTEVLRRRLVGVQPAALGSANPFPTPPPSPSGPPSAPPPTMVDMVGVGGGPE